MDIDPILVRQAGVVSLDQALFAGMSARTVQRRVECAAWRELHPRTYLVGGHRLTDEARVRAAALWAGDRATVSGAAAAFWHGMVPRAPAAVEVTVPTAVRLRARDGVRVLRRDLNEVDRRPRHRLWVTAPPLTVLQTATARDDGSTFLDRALQRHVHLDDLRTAHRRHLGMRGSARAGQLLAAAADGAESAAERLLVGHLRRARITGWVLGLPFGPRRACRRSGRCSHDRRKWAPGVTGDA